MQHSFQNTLVVSDSASSSVITVIDNTLVQMYQAISSEFEGLEERLRGFCTLAVGVGGGKKKILNEVTDATI